MKKNGFSLVEFLTIIIILFIILIVAIPKIIVIVTDSRQEVFDSSEKMIVKAAETYVSAKKIPLPVEINSTIEIKYTTLKSLGYISEVKDPKSMKECTNSTVIVTKKSETEYTYTANLLCENYKSNN